MFKTYKPFITPLLLIISILAAYFFPDTMFENIVTVISFIIILFIPILAIILLHGFLLSDKADENIGNLANLSLDEPKLFTTTLQLAFASFVGFNIVLGLVGWFWFFGVSFVFTVLLFLAVALILHVTKEEVEESLKYFQGDQYPDSVRDKAKKEGR